MPTIPELPTWVWGIAVIVIVYFVVFKKKK